MLNLRGLIKISISNGRKLHQQKKFQLTSFQFAGQVSFFLRMRAATFFSAFNCDDGARFWVDGEQILQPKFGRIVLEANKEYEIKFEFMENRGLATAILEWIEPANVPVKLK